MMVDNGRVLATRSKGLAVAHHLEELANHVANEDQVLIDFEGVEVVNSPFMQEVLHELDLLFGDRPQLINMNDDVGATIDFVRGFMRQ